jgi:GxxExxY protein
MTYEPNPIVSKILACAIRVHRDLGPGLLESTYERCLAYDFTLSHVEFRSQVSIPALYRGQRVNCGYRADFIVEDAVLLELKAVERLLPLYDAQVLTYLKLTGLPRALMINFNVTLLKAGIRSFIRSDSSSTGYQPDRHGEAPVAGPAGQEPRTASGGIAGAPPKTP